jgi:hypothetical protein
LKLAALKERLASRETIEEKFAEADADHSGGLDAGELQNM